MNPFSVFSTKNKVNPEISMRKKELSSAENSHIIDSALAEVPQGELPVDGQAKADLTRWQQELDPELKKMGMRLRNYYQNEEGEWVARYVDGKTLDPLCSEEFISELVAILEPATSRNLMMSNLSEDFIRRKLIDMSNTVTLLEIADRKRFGIRMNNLTPIIRIFQATAEPTYFRALQGNEKKYLGTIQRNIYTKQDKPGEEKKKNFLNMGM
ncbi:hypothetical protein LCGC14_1467080 [marine sediment metagenome]|uniref:Uncharacterized protein n=1 Tax=marine sediment metagenome TaxID=412755 RepID=A0A0F9JDH6_9ZZZZ